MSVFFYRHRQSYYDLLSAVSERGAWSDWVSFFLRGVTEQSLDAVERAEDGMRLAGGVVVCAVGVGRWERDPEEQATAGAGYREAQMPKRLVLSSPDDGPLLLSDEPSMVR